MSYSLLIYSHFWNFLVANVKLMTKLERFTLEENDFYFCETCKLNTYNVYFTISSQTLRTYFNFFDHVRGFLLLLSRVYFSPLRTDLTFFLMEKLLSMHPSCFDCSSRQLSSLFSISKVFVWFPQIPEDFGEGLVHRRGRKCFRQLLL